MNSRFALQIYKWMEDVEREDSLLISSAVYGNTFEGRDIKLLKVLHLAHFVV